MVISTIWKETKQKHGGNLNICEVTDTAVLVIVDHLKILASDLKDRISDLKELDLPF